MTATNRATADRYAALKAIVDAAEKELKLLKAEIVATGSDLVQGDEYDVKVNLGERKTLDAKAVLAALGADWVAANTKATTYEILKVVPKAVTVDLSAALAA
jgi:cell division ATPase FtsA